MLSSLLMLFALITPRTFALFETPFTSLLSKSTVYFYPSLVPGFVPEFYVDPFSKEGYVLLTGGNSCFSSGGVISVSDRGLFVCLGLRRGSNSLGFGMNYNRGSENVNSVVFSFSHRTAVFGYDAGFLVEGRDTRKYVSGYVRTFRNITDQIDIVAGIRGISDEDRGISGFLGTIFSPVSGQYMEGVIGYAPWLRQLYISASVSHQFYRNFALSMGFYYPLKDFSFSPVSRSILESPGNLPPYPDFRIGLDLQDNSSIYTFSFALDYKVVQDFISTGVFHPSTYEFRTAFSVYFYSF